MLTLILFNFEEDRTSEPRPSPNSAFDQSLIARNAKNEISEDGKVFYWRIMIATNGTIKYVEGKKIKFDEKGIDETAATNIRISFDLVLNVLLNDDKTEQHKKQNQIECILRNIAMDKDQIETEKKLRFLVIMRIC